MSQVAANGPLSSAPVPHDLSAPLPVKPLNPAEHSMDNQTLGPDSLAAKAASAAAPVGTKRAVVTNPGGPREGELKRLRPTDDLTTDRDHATSPSLLHETQAMEQDHAPPPVQAAAANNNVTLANNGVLGIKPSPAGSPRNVSILPPRPVRPASSGAEPGLDKASLSDPLMNLQVRHSPKRDSDSRSVSSFHMILAGAGVRCCHLTAMSFVLDHHSSAYHPPRASLFLPPHSLIDHSISVSLLSLPFLPSPLPSHNLTPPSSLCS